MLPALFGTLDFGPKGGFSYGGVTHLLEVNPFPWLSRSTEPFCGFSLVSIAFWMVEERCKTHDPSVHTVLLFPSSASWVAVAYNGPKILVGL